MAPRPPMVACAVAALALLAPVARAAHHDVPFTYAVPCNAASYAGLGLGSAGAGCLPTSPGTAGCLRHAEDDFITPEETAQLLRMVDAGFARGHRAVGPTILDVNTGYLREGARVANVYRPEVDPATGAEVAPAVAFNASDLALYGAVFERIRARIVQAFNLSALYFTAPTFVTRIVGAPGWAPEDVHDEYWHAHVDMANTRHYHFSGLLYLSTAGRDFEGGRFAFLRRREGGGGGDDDDDDAEEEHVVQPRAGRLVAFSSGAENLHAVRPVTAGTRTVFSMWFSCDPRKEFVTFLDNKAHSRFGSASAAGTDDGQRQGVPAQKRKRRPPPVRRPAAAANAIIRDEL